MGSFRYDLFFKWAWKNTIMYLCKDFVKFWNPVQVQNIIFIRPIVWDIMYACVKPKHNFEEFLSFERKLGE